MFAEPTERDAQRWQWCSQRRRFLAKQTFIKNVAVKKSREQHARGGVDLCSASLLAHRPAISRACICSRSSPSSLVASGLIGEIGTPELSDGPWRRSRKTQVSVHGLFRAPEELSL
jgi:hypothetical protein